MFGCAHLSLCSDWRPSRGAVSFCRGLGTRGRLTEQPRKSFRVTRSKPNPFSPKPDWRKKLSKPQFAIRPICIARLSYASALDETMAAADQSLFELYSGNLHDAIQKALFCTPADPLVWLTLVWLDVRRHGFEPRDANYLRLSYDLGPNEAWIGLWRTRIAIASFQQLPPDLSERATGEFVKLGNTGWFYRETAQIFGRAAPAARSASLTNSRPRGQ